LTPCRARVLCSTPAVGRQPEALITPAFHLLAAAVFVSTYPQVNLVPSPHSKRIGAGRHICVNRRRTRGDSLRTSQITRWAVMRKTKCLLAQAMDRSRSREPGLMMPYTDVCSSPVINLTRGSTQKLPK